MTFADQAQDKLISAICKGDLGQVKHCLEQGAALTPLENSNGLTPVHWAAIKGHPEVIRFLVDSGAPVSPVDARAATPLHWAAGNGHPEAVRCLLAAKAPVNQTDARAATPLHWAAIKGHPEVVRLLLEREAAVNQPDGKRLTALHWAAIKGQLEVLRLLVESGAAVSPVDEQGATPLHWAAIKRHPELVLFLLGAGAAVNQMDGLGLTALHCAAKQGDVEVLRLLLEAGAAVNQAAGRNVWTALHWAAEHGHFEVVRLLLEAGAVVNQVPDEQAWTALHWASEEGHSRIVRLLVLYGASDEAVPDATETRALRELGECLRAARRELEHSGSIDVSTCARWERLHAANPGLYLELARLSPQLHRQAQVCFGAYPDGYYWKWLASLPSHGLPDLKLPVIRRVAMDYLKAQGSALSSGAAVSEAINNVLRDHVHRSPDGIWELGELAPYWEKYKTEPDAHLGTLVQLWGLLSREQRALNDYRGERLSVFLGKVKQLKQEYAQDWVMASCGLPGEWSSDTLTVYERTLVLRLQACQYLTEFARAVIFNQEFSWDALQVEIEALKAFPEYPLRKDLQYFFSGFLKGMWELDKCFFERLNPAQKVLLRKVADYAECPQLQSPLSEAKPEELDAVRGFDAEVAQAADASIPSCDAYWPALRQALRHATSPESSTLTASTFVYRAMAPQAAAEAKEERGCQPAAKKARYS